LDETALPDASEHPSTLYDDPIATFKADSKQHWAGSSSQCHVSEISGKTVSRWPLLTQWLRLWFQTLTVCSRRH